MTRWTSLSVVIGLLLSAAVFGASGTTIELTPAVASAPASQASGPGVPIILVKKPVHDFGEVWVGDLLHAFTLENAGQADLKITRVKPVCGCTTAGEYPRTIAPGESGDLPFKLSSERYNGPFSTTISLETNDPAHKETTLTLRGSAKHYVRVEPRAASFGRVKADLKATRTLVLTNNCDTPMKPLIVNPQPSETFTARLVEVEAGRKYELVVTASPPYQPKFNRHLMQIDTAIPNAPPLKIYCTAILPERLDVLPEVIYIPANQTASSRRITFTNNGDAPVKLLSASVLDNALKVTTSEKTEGKEYDIVVSIPGGYLPPPAGTEIVLKTDDSEKPELRIPVRRTPSAAAADIARPPQAQAQTQAPRQPRPKPAMQLVGKPAPEVAVKTADDKDLQIGGATNKVQLVMFYASWCGFCRRALPEVEKIYEQYKSKDVSLVTVNIDRRTGRSARTEAQTLDQYKQLKLSLPLVLDPEQKVSGQYQMQGTGVPAFFLVGKDGTVEAMHTGYRVATDKTLANEMDVLLEGKTRADFPSAQQPASQPAPGG